MRPSSQYRIEDLIDEGKLSEALQTVNEALEKQPDDVGLLDLKGRTLYNLNRYDEVVPICDKILELDPTATAAFVSKSSALREIGRFEESLYALNKAIEDGHGDFYVRMTKAKLLAILGKFDESLMLARQELKKDPENLKAQEVNANILSMACMHEDAAKQLEEITKADPRWVEKIIDMSDEYRYAKNFSKALTAIDRAIDIIDDEPMLFTRKAEILYELGRSEEALKHIEIAQSIDRVYAETWYQKAIILSKTDYDESLDALLVAASLNPDIAKRAQTEESFRHFLTNDRFKKLTGLKEQA